jgi:hypothetical protein
MESIDLNENTKLEQNTQEGEEVPFMSVIIKDLNDMYIRYDVKYLFIEI